MKHPLTHVVPRQNMFVPQLLPLIPDHELVLTLGWQLSHELLGSTVPAGSNVVPISHPAWHAPAWQISPVPHAAPSDEVVQSEVLSCG